MILPSIKSPGVLANSKKIMKEASSSIGSVCSRRLRMKFLMTVSHQPPVNPAARDLFDDFYIRQAAGQAVVDIRLKAADAGAAGGKDLAIA
ncbi:hypothetical protein KPZU40_33080 [Klebsiella pneumoniae]|nr:hypothetical protein KPZU40_33080 [Klebsiella pneumoniae]